MPKKVKESQPGPPAKDRKTSLVLIGILDILIGLVCALMAPLMVFGYMVTKDATTAPKSLTLSMTLGLCAIYLALATLAVWAGIGLCLCRRWARTLVLVASWIGLVVGSLGTLGIFFFMPGMTAWMAQQPNMNPDFIMVFKWLMSLFFLAFFVLLPGIHVLVLGHVNVGDTCRYRDPKTRWTDAAPMPVLALSLLNVYMALTLLCYLGYPGLPVFNLILTGAAAKFFCVLSAGAFLWLARETFLLRMRGWLGSLVAMALCSLSMIVTFSVYDLAEIYEKIGLSADQVATVKQMPFFQGSTFNYYILAWTLIYGAYFFYCRKYFVEKAGQ